MSSEELMTSFSDFVASSSTRKEGQTNSSGDSSSEGDLQVTCFTEDLHDVTLHFQIVRFSKQVNKVSWFQSKYQTEISVNSRFITSSLSVKNACATSNDRLECWPIRTAKCKTKRKSSYR